MSVAYEKMKSTISRICHFFSSSIELGLLSDLRFTLQHPYKNYLRIGHTPAIVR